MGGGPAGTGCARGADGPAGETRDGSGEPWGAVPSAAGAAWPEMAAGLQCRGSTALHAAQPSSCMPVCSTCAQKSGGRAARSRSRSAGRRWSARHGRRRSAKRRAARGRPRPPRIWCGCLLLVAACACAAVLVSARPQPAVTLFPCRARPALRPTESSMHVRLSSGWAAGRAAELRLCSMGSR